MIKKAAKLIHHIYQLNDEWEDTVRLQKVEYTIAEELENSPGTTKTAWGLVYTLRRIRYESEIQVELMSYKDRRNIIKEVIRLAELVISRLNEQKKRRRNQNENSKTINRGFNISGVYYS